MILTPALRIILGIATVSSTYRMAYAQPSNSVLDAIAFVETSGEKNPNIAIGDNGKALGKYQIHRDYFADAIEFNKALAIYKYEDVTDPNVARKIVIAYITRYGGKNVSDEAAARIHNGGPRGHKKNSTLGYWKKIQNAMR